MSGSNSSVAPVPEITLAELERLIQLLGMLGSEHDGEVLAAARFAQKWVTKQGTDWRTLLTPPEEALPVTGVGPPINLDRLAQAQEIDRVEAYQRGFQAGVRDAMAKVKAQATFAQQASYPAGATFTTGLGGGLGGAGTGPGVGGGQTAQGPVRASGGRWAAGSWQAVCQELLGRHAAGIPGVFRGPNEESFVTDVLARGFATLTPAQDKWLRDIAGRNGLSW